jgi:hypothetical protein
LSESFVAAICLCEVGDLSVVGNGRKGRMSPESREEDDGKI